MKFQRAITLTIALLTSPVLSNAGGDSSVGNGGDHIRFQFVQMGRSVLRYLENDEAGNRLKKNHGLDRGKLEKSLEVGRIFVSTAPLFDNRGSKVDAVGKRGYIFLSEKSWAEHFSKRRDVFYLVFHEMLRSAAYNDENYRISAAIHPFPHQWTRADEETTESDVFQLSPEIAQPEGTACRGKLARIESHSEEKKFNIYFEDSSPVRSNFLLTEIGQQCVFKISAELRDSYQLEVQMIEASVQVLDLDQARVFSSVWLSPLPNPPLLFKRGEVEIRPGSTSVLLRNPWYSAVGPCGGGQFTIEVALTLSARLEQGAKLKKPSLSFKHATVFYSLRPCRK